MQPHLLLNALNCLRKAISLTGAYTLTSAGCKKDFNKGMLPVAHIWSYMEEGNGVKHQDLEAIEKFKIASNPSSEFDVGRGSSPGHVLHPFLLALHTNLAADVAKLGVCRAHTGRGGGHWSLYRL